MNLEQDHHPELEYIRHVLQDTSVLSSHPLAPAQFQAPQRKLILELANSLHERAEPVNLMTLQREATRQGVRLDLEHLLKITNTLPIADPATSRSEIERSALARAAAAQLRPAVNMLDRGDLRGGLSIVREVRSQGDSTSGWLTDAFVPVGQAGPEDWLDVPPPPRDWLLTRDGGVPVLGRGVVGMLVARGGMGKSWALTQLAIAFVTGTRWLDAFDCAPVHGRVLLALAEEDTHEVRRRVHAAVRAADLTEAQRQMVRERLVALGLAGRQVSLVRSEGDNVQASHLHTELVGLLRREQHPLVLLDPLTRWAPGIEGDNDRATTAIQLLEQLAQAAQGSVLVAHHTAKVSRRDGEGNATDGARGVTGLTDGARWVAVLEHRTEEADLALSVTKTNYAPPVEPIALVRDPETGALRTPNSMDVDLRRTAKARADRAQVDALEAVVLQTLRDQPRLGLKALRDEVRRVSGKASTATIDLAVRSLVASGEVQDEREGNAHRYSLAGTCRDLPNDPPASGRVLAAPTPPPLRGEGAAASACPTPRQLPLADAHGPSRQVQRQVPDLGSADGWGLDD